MKYVAVLASALVTIASGAISAPSAAAAPVHRAAGPCGSAAHAQAPSWYHRRDADAAVSRAEVVRVQRQLDHAVPAGHREPGGESVIPVRAHIVRSTHRHDHHATKAQVRAEIRHLNLAYSGGEDPGVAADTGFRFRLRSISVSRNDRWYRIGGPGATANAMKRSLHRGRQFTLNMYVLDLTKGEGLLGYTTFPWRYHARPQLDGIVVAAASLPGGTLPQYHEGDTAVHESGHWLGLFHPFQDGCDGIGDEVADTPAEAEPDYECTDQDSCPDQPGLDPIHNFMNYSPDSCMNQFTAGQAGRMHLAWEQFRRP